MKYRLGQFHLVEQQIRVLIERLVRADLARSRRVRHDAARVATQRYLRQLRSRMAERRSEEPDLLEALDPGHPDRPWLDEVHDALAADGRSSSLQVCEHEPGDGGFTALAVHRAGGGRQVRRGDEILAGFAALRDGEGGLRIWPRTYRVVCSNGAMVASGGAEDILASAGSVTEAVRRSMSGERLSEACVAYRAGSAMDVADPRAFLSTVSGRPLEGGDVADVLREWRRARDGSLWGLVNAVTAMARDRGDVRARFRMERFAGRLALLASAPREGTGRAVRAARAADGRLQGAELSASMI